MRWDANQQEKRATREQRRRKEAKLRQGLNHPPKYLSSPNSTHSQLPGPQPTEFTQYDHETLEPGSVGAQLKAQHDLNGNTFSSVQPMNCNDWNSTPPKSAKQVKEEYLRSQKKPWV